MDNSQFDVVAIEYPGYSYYKVEGRDASEDTVIEDAINLMRHLIFKKKIPIQSIVVVGKLEWLKGRSIGTGVAVEIAKRFLDIAGLILVSPFTSIADVAFDISGVGTILRILTNIKNFCSIDKIASVRCPIASIHGTKDSLISHKQSDQLKSKSKWWR